MTGNRRLMQAVKANRALSTGAQGAHLGKCVCVCVCECVCVLRCLYVCVCFVDQCIHDSQRTNAFLAQVCVLFADFYLSVFVCTRMCVCLCVFVCCVCV